MFRIVRIVIPFAMLLGLFGQSSTHAQGSPAWSPMYPKAGPDQGTIAIKGTTALDPEWSCSGGGQVLVWPKNGGPKLTFQVPVNPVTGAWGEFIIQGLTPGAEYNLIVQIAVVKKNPMGEVIARATIAPPPAVATAKP